MAVCVAYLGVPAKNNKAFAFVPAIAAFQIVLTLMSMYMQPGGTLGVYLSNIKQISLENLKLTREILTQIGIMQGQILDLPGEIRDILIENNEFNIKDLTQKSIDDLTSQELLISSNGNIDYSRINSCIESCRMVAAKRNSPYGVGGVAGMCAPILISNELRCHSILNNIALGKDIIRNIYIPWLDNILNQNISGSITNKIYKISNDLIKFQTTINGQVLNKSRNDFITRLSDNIVKLSLNSSPNQYAECSHELYIRELYYYLVKCYHWDDSIDGCIDRRIENQKYRDTNVSIYTEAKLISSFNPIPENLQTPSSSQVGPLIALKFDFSSNFKKAFEKIPVTNDVALDPHRESNEKFLEDSIELRNIYSDVDYLNSNIISPINAMRTSLYMLLHLRKSIRGCRNALKIYVSY